MEQSTASPDNFPTSDVGEAWAKHFAEMRATVAGLPRVWELPQEPGPEVTAVRDCNRDVWRRPTDCLGWGLAGKDWGWLVWNFGPLTDASDEVTP